MKTSVAVVLLLGIVSAIASPVTISTEEQPPGLPTLQNTESENEEISKEPVEITEVTESAEPVVGIEDETASTDKEIDIIIEDDTPMPLDDIPEPQSNINEQFSLTNLLYRNALASQMEGELEAAAKGFAPIPIFKRKQMPRRRFAIRRKFTPYPYRRYSYYGYPYYAFYRPSSLRFY